MGMKAAERSLDLATVATESGKMMILRERAVEAHTDDARLPQPMIFRLAKKLGLDITINGLGEAKWQKIEAAMDDGGDEELDEMCEIIDSIGGEEALDVVRVASQDSEFILFWDEDRLSKE